MKYDDLSASAPHLTRVREIERKKRRSTRKGGFRQPRRRRRRGMKPKKMRAIESAYDAYFLGKLLKKASPVTGFLAKVKKVADNPLVRMAAAVIPYGATAMMAVDMASNIASKVAPAAEKGDVKALAGMGLQALGKSKSPLGGLAQAGASLLGAGTEAETLKTEGIVRRRRGTESSPPPELGSIESKLNLGVSYAATTNGVPSPRKLAVAMALRDKVKNEMRKRAFMPGRPPEDVSPYLKALLAMKQAALAPTLEDEPDETSEFRQGIPTT